MTKDQMLAARDLEYEEIARLKAELFSAQRRSEDARRDLKEADAGKRFGMPLTFEQARETRRVAAVALDKVRATQARLSAANERLRKINAKIAAVCASRPDGAQDRARGETKEERRVRRQGEHETRMLQLLAAARGMVSMENAELWLARLEGCVAELDYCDTRIEGVLVPMPWDAEP